MPILNKNNSATPSDAPQAIEPESAALEPDTLQLSEEDSRHFLDTVQKAPPPNENLRAAAKRLAEMEAKKPK
jgi:uncharacterized protein (DUF1778 family)